MKDGQIVPVEQKPIPKEFYDHLGLIACLADSIVADRLKPFERGAPEISAYQQTYEYQDLKNIVRASGIELTMPERLKYEGQPLRVCIDKFWKRMKLEIGMRSTTVKLMEEALDQHRVETAEWKRSIQQKRADLRDKVNNIGKLPE